MNATSSTRDEPAARNPGDTHEAIEQERSRTFVIWQAPGTRWFDVWQLLGTAAATIASTVIGSMTGRRELMAALGPASESRFDLSRRDEVWLDYMADCGDGWNASYSMAWLLGRDAIKLRKDGQPTPQPVPPKSTAEADLKPDRNHLVLPAGKALILGGDQVYPTASHRAYQRRFTSPLTCARNFQEGGRRLFVLPGNHDWYDGLTTFVRLFCQSKPNRRWFGAWQTRQRRSYFSIKLPHGWWLWGIDLALEDDLDPPQNDFFWSEGQRLKRGDKVILAVPAPVWLKVDAAEATRNPLASRTFDKLGLVMKHALERPDVTVPLVLTGDLHFYAHHRVRTPQLTRDYVVAGGGGAYGLGTTQVPEKIMIGDGQIGTCAALFPDRKTSGRLRWNALFFPFRNVFFTTALVAVQFVLVWLIWADRYALATPGIVLWAMAIVLGFTAFGASGAQYGRSKAVAFLAGCVHGVLQIAGFFTIGIAAAKLGAQSGLEWFAALAVMYVHAGLLFGLYLTLSHRIAGMHDQEVFSSQGIEDYKNFLRLKVDAHGVTVHPIGLKKACRAWQAAPGVTLRDPTTDLRSQAKRMMVDLSNIKERCLRIIDPRTPLQPHLIEPPFTLGKVQAVK